ncbi:MAG: DUF6364 family protein [Leeuwenhoekiella sp.]
MDTKLALKLNQEIIEKAKAYAADKKISLSRIVESYLQSLTTYSKYQDDLNISPFVKSFSSGTKIPLDADKTEYIHHLIEKYK